MSLLSPRFDSRHCSSVYSRNSSDFGSTPPPSYPSSPKFPPCDERPAAYGITFYIYDKPLPPLPKEALESSHKPLPPLPLNVPKTLKRRISNQQLRAPVPVDGTYYDEKEVYLPYSDEKEVFLSVPGLDEKRKVQ